MGWAMGFEPTTTGITIQYSNQLSYAHHQQTGWTCVHPCRVLRSASCLTRFPPEGGKRPKNSATSPTVTQRLITTGGAPDRTRTCNRRLRRPMLYPVELRAHRQPCIVPPHTGTRRQPSLVGVEGFEPPTSCSQSRRATRLRYTPACRSTAQLHACKQPAMVRTTATNVNRPATARIIRIRNKKGAEAPLVLDGAPGEIRTPDPQVRSLVLYPAELRAQFSCGLETTSTMPPLSTSSTTADEGARLF